MQFVWLCHHFNKFLCVYVCMQGCKLTNGQYGIEWIPWKGKNCSLKWTEMKVRPLYLWVERSAMTDMTGWWRWRGSDTWAGVVPTRFSVDWRNSLTNTNRKYIERYKHKSSLDVYWAIIVTDICALIQYNTIVNWKKISFIEQCSNQQTEQDLEIGAVFDRNVGPGSLPLFYITFCSLAMYFSGS